LQGTKDLCPTYHRTGSKELFTTYSDADYGGDKDNGKSTSGYCIIVGGGAISWRSKVQTFVVASTTEAEFVAAFEAGREIHWLRSLLQELGYKLRDASSLNVNNQSAISVAKNPEHHGRMKAMVWTLGTIG
jgi:hypothetical protein